MRAPFWSVMIGTVVILLACSVGVSGEEIRLIVWTGKPDPGAFKGKFIRLNESQAMAVGKINNHLDLDGHIDVIETPFEDVLRDVGLGRNIIIAVEVDALRKADVSLNRLITLRSEKVPLRECLHELLDPLRLTFEVCPDGLLITSAPEKEAPSDK